MDQNKQPSQNIPPVKRSWEEIVKNSNGTALFVPEVLLGTVKQWQEKKKEFEDSLKIMAKQELVVSNLFQNLMFEIRKYAETAGHDDIWTKDIGFDGNAMKDGKFIINISDGK